MRLGIPGVCLWRGVILRALDKAGFSLSQLSQAAEGNRAPLEETIRLVAKAIDGDYGGGASKAFTFLREQLDGAASGAEGAEAKLSILSRSTDKVGLSFGGAATLAKGLYAPLKSALDLAQSETRAKAVADAALEATNAYNALVLANAELVKFLNPAAGTFSAEVTKLISQLPGIGSQVQSGFDLGGAIGQADIDNALAGFDTTLADLVQKGVEAGLSADEIKKAIAALPIPELQITDEAKKALNQDIADLVLSDKIDIVVESNKTKLVADAKATAAKYGAVILGEKGNLKDAGAQLTAGLTEGMRAGAAKVAAAATAIARQAQAAFKSAMQISSPSKVFVGYGENIGQGLVLGIEAFMPKIGQVATDLGGSIGSAAADGIRRSTEEASAALGEFIDKLNSDISSAQLDAIKGSLLGGQTLDMARTGIGSDLAGIIDAGKAIADSIKEGKGGSFGFSGLEGLGNRQDVFGVVSEIKDLAETLFDVGTPIGDIVNELSFMREALLSTASAAGFNRTELEGLIDSLGLSQGAINSLASATADAQRQVVDAAAAEKAKADALAQADANAQATQDAERGNATTIINNIAIPYGDLEAVALAVSNRQASAASRRIRR